MEKNNIVKIVGQNPVTIKIDKECAESESTILLKKRMKSYNQRRAKYGQR